MAGQTTRKTITLPQFNFEQTPSDSKKKIEDLEDAKKAAKNAEEITG
jgi:hypothetical protein